MDGREEQSKPSMYVIICTAKIDRVVASYLWPCWCKIHAPACCQAPERESFSQSQYQMVFFTFAVLFTNAVVYAALVVAAMQKTVPL